MTTVLDQLTKISRLWRGTPWPGERDAAAAAFLRVAQGTPWEGVDVAQWTPAVVAARRRQEEAKRHQEESLRRFEEARQRVEEERRRRLALRAQIGRVLAATSFWPSGAYVRPSYLSKDETKFLNGLVAALCSRDLNPREQARWSVLLDSWPVRTALTRKREFDEGWARAARAAQERRNARGQFLREAQDAARAG